MIHDNTVPYVLAFAEGDFVYLRTISVAIYLLPNVNAT